jgi:hypothetical protein
MNKEKLLSIINKYVGYAEQEIYDAVAEYEEEKISFAKKHCEAALKTAWENAEIKQDIFSESGEPIYEINHLSILNSYPLENIK